MQKLAFFLFLFFVITTFGCADGKRDDAPATGRQSNAHATLEGSLTENAAKLLKGSFRAKCDEKFEPLRQEIAAALDARQAEITAKSRELLTDDKYKVVPFGPTQLREQISVGAAQGGWQEDKYGWAELIEDYKAIKDKPVDKFWVQLNVYYRGFMMDEIERIVNGANYQLTKDHRPALNAFYEELLTCAKAKDCVLPKLTPESQAFLDSQKRYQEEWDEVGKAKAGEEKHAAYADLIQWVKADVEFYEFRKNPSVKLIAPGHYELPLALGIFAGAEAQVRKHFAEVWEAEGKKVTLKLEKSPSQADIFSLVLGTEFGGRSYVTFKAKEVTLMPMLTSRTIAHELGHVLGFKDNYVNTWDPETCGWNGQTQDADIMSAASTGKVLDVHWAKMEEMYK